jgi:glycosyltransferase involved in cell wall biosynthesis
LPSTAHGRYPDNAERPTYTNSSFDMITVAITSFNRGDLVCRAIGSALSFVRPLGGRVIVVDDGSPEPIFPFIHAAFNADLHGSVLTHVRSDINGGVTAAKNVAFAHSDPGWVIFLDSDDELIPESATDVADALASRPKDALMFFRCVDQNGNFFGRYFSEPQALTLPRYLVHTSYGEALVAINKAAAPDPPFDSDLRGYEGMGCARLIHRFGPALLMPIIARRYHRVGDDRLSTFSCMMTRSKHLYRGHLRYVRLFGEHMSPSTRLKYRAKAGVYFMLSAFGSARRY